jgi:hypothetical protein
LNVLLAGAGSAGDTAGVLLVGDATAALDCCDTEGVGVDRSKLIVIHAGGLARQPRA